MAPTYKIFDGGNAGVATVPNIQGDSRDLYARQIVDSAGNVVYNVPPPGVADIATVTPAGAGNFGLPFKLAHFHYSFATQGGAISTIALSGVTGIPSGSLIYGGLMRVITVPDSASHTATIGIQVNAANDLVNATAVSGAPYSTTGIKALIPVMTAATAIRLTAARDVSIVIAVEALTQGEFTITLCYIPFS